MDQNKKKLHCGSNAALILKSYLNDYLFAGVFGVAGCFELSFFGASGVFGTSGVFGGVVPDGV